MANNNHFDLTLDTIAPTGSITRAFIYGKTNAAMTISGSGTPSHMKVWFNTTQVGTKADSGYSSASWETFATSKQTAFSTDGLYYYHLVLKDDVGNESEVYNTELMTFDTTKPTVSNQYLEDPDGEESVKRQITNQLTNNIGFSYADNLSGVVSGRLVCSDFTEDILLTLIGSGSYSGQVTFKNEGQKTVDIYVTDAAGNESLKASATITVDMSMDKPIVTLLKNQETEETLPANINYIQIKVKVTSTDTDIVGYKIWESGTTEPEWTTPVSPATTISFPVIQPFTLSDSDGTKTINVKVKDMAGTEISADTVSVVLDRVAPTVAISRTGNEYISNVASFTSSEISVTCTDDRSGIKSYIVYCNDSVIDQGTTQQTGKTITITSATTGMVEGENIFKIVATDNAENSVESATATIKLDTTAPTASLPNLNTWYNTTFGINGISFLDGDGSGVHGIYVWSDTSNTKTTIIPEGCVEITPPTENITASAIKFNLQQTKDNYMHIVVKDNVGNVAAGDLKTFGYDNVKPTGSISCSQPVYSSTSASVILSITDATSGQSQVSPYNQYCKITGDITNPDSDFVQLTGTRSVTLTTGDGMKTIYAQFKDAAGNISEQTYSASCELDTTTPSGTLSLYDAGTTTTKKTPSNIKTADAKITYSDDSLGSGYYKVWGNFYIIDGSTKTEMPTTEELATWIEITPTAGKKEFTLNLECTNGDGQKNISVRLKDNAGHEYPASGSSALTANFVYDSSAINVKAGNPDFNRISKVFVQREGASAGKMCDEINFTFFADDGTGHASDEVFTAFKVCAYENSTAAAAGSANDAPIPSIAEDSAGNKRSINLSADGIAQTGEVNVKLVGLDFEAALNGGTEYTGTEHVFDGTHIIVVYMKDAAGTWSEAASFNA